MGEYDESDLGHIETEMEDIAGPGRRYSRGRFWFSNIDCVRRRARLRLRSRVEQTEQSRIE